MVENRVIPIIQIDERGYLIKTKQYKPYWYCGEPINSVRIFNEKMADEIIIMDVSRNPFPNFDLINKITSECFMPVCYAGKVKGLSTAIQLLKSGVDKVGIGSLILDNPIEVEKMIKTLGSSTFVAIINYKINVKTGRLEVFHPYMLKFEAKSPIDLLIECEQMGFGELLFYNADRDGKFCGLDLSLIAQVSQLTKVPTIFAGGVYSLSDLENGFFAGAKAIACGSYFNLTGRLKTVLVSYLDRKTIQGFQKIENDRV